MEMNYATSDLPERFNFAAHVLQLNAGRPDKPAYIDDNGQLTYAELAGRVRCCAAGLLALGLQPEQRVLLVMHDTVDFPVAFLGALYAGLVPVPVNTLLPPEDHAYMLVHSGARAILASAALLPGVQQAIALAGSALPLVVSGDCAALPEGAHSFTGLLDAPELAVHADTAGDQFAFWLYSSGSTGRPKGTVHSHANLYWTAELYAKQVLGLRDSDTVFSAAKLYFAYGLGNALTFPLCAGATAILMAERPTPAAVFERLRRHRPTVFCGVPTLYVAMLAADAPPARADTALRICTSAGEALPREIGEKFHAHYGCDILDGLGSTEMLHIFISNRSGDIRYGATGKPVPGYEVELRDEGGQPVPAGEIGDLYIRGPSAALLYWNNRTKSRATFLGDWIKSGDKYVADADGYYTYAGRSDDMLKVSGQYVSPIEVEAVLMGHAAVLECAVVGVPNQLGLTHTQAYVVAQAGHDGGPALAQELQTWVKARMAPHKYPREVIFIAELPKTATGKIQRFKLRAVQ
ncbi:MAG: benzoate-CoA ligase family protein [Pseudomonadota bacterium]